MCVHCRRFVRQLRVTVRALAKLRDAEPVPPAEQDELLELFRRATEGGPKPPSA
jgi:hypothetical protein